MCVPDVGKTLEKEKRNIEDSKLKGVGKYHSAVSTINIYFVSYDNKRKIL